jgi:hypothetical protein
MQLTLLLHVFALSRTSGHPHAHVSRAGHHLSLPPVSSHSAHTQRNLFCYPCGLDWAGTFDTQLSHCSWIYACRLRRPLENCYFLFPALRRAANGTIQQAVDEHYGNFVATPPSSGDPNSQQFGWHPMPASIRPVEDIPLRQRRTYRTTRLKGIVPHPALYIPYRTK